MVKSVKFLMMVSSLMVMTNSYATSILVLGDDQSESIINPYLESQGHTVFNGSLYYDWSGDIPTGTDVILYLNGYEYGYDLGEDGDPIAANQSMLDFVAEGGGLIFTEWYAYDRKEEPVADLMPVTYNGDYYYEAEWGISEGAEHHEFMEGLLSTSFTQGDGNNDTYSDVIAKDGTVVIMEDDAGIPLLSYNNNYGGTVVHINDGMSYGDDMISDEMLSVINNSVKYAASTGQAIPAPASMLLFGLCLLGFSRRKSLAK